MKILSVFFLYFLSNSITHSSHSDRFLQECPGLNKNLACDPNNIDKFIEYHLDKGDNISHILMKTHMYGTCYHKSTKYCPTVLKHCNSSNNHGKAWSLTGFCQKRGEACSDVEIKPTCINITCKHNQYLCYPKGCISKDLACFGKCPNSGNIKMTSCGDKCIEESEAQGMYSCGETCLKKTQICNLGQKKNCSQHYNICGNECVESFTQALWESQTGLPLYHSCDGQCLNYSQPCDGHCGQGYWQCASQTQCIIASVLIEEKNISSLCDGKLDCDDWSDESLAQCLEVYKEEFKILIVFTVILVGVSIFCNYIIQRKILIIKCYGKRKLQEMHMMSAHQSSAKNDFEIEILQDEE